MARKGKPFEVESRHQSREEEEVNGNDAIVQIEATFPRYPFLVMLDEIVSLLGQPSDRFFDEYRLTKVISVES